MEFNVHTNYTAHIGIDRFDTVKEKLLNYVEFIAEI